MLRWGLIIGLVVGIVAVGAGLVFVAAIKPGKLVSPDRPDRLGLDYERVTFLTADGLELAGWFVPQPKTRAVLIVGHGYPFDKGNILRRTIFLHQRYNLLYFDLRYLGESAGKYTSFGVHERKDVAAAIAYLKTRREVDPGRIGLVGFSLSATTFILAHPQEARVMVLDSPFESLTALLAETYGFLPGPLRWPLIALDRFYAWFFLGIRVDEVSALSEMPSLKCPVLLIQGEQDDQISLEHGRHLFAACTASVKEFWIVARAGHNQTYALDPAAYEARVFAFLDRFLVPEKDLKGE